MKKGMSLTQALTEIRQRMETEIGHPLPVVMDYFSDRLERANHEIVQLLGDIGYWRFCRTPHRTDEEQRLFAEVVRQRVAYNILFWTRRRVSGEVLDISLPPDYGLPTIFLWQETEKSEESVMAEGALRKFARWLRQQRGLWVGLE